LLALLIQFNNGTQTVSSVADSAGSTWVSAGASGNASKVACQGETTDIWYTASTAGAVTSVTVTTSGGQSWFGVAYEISGANASAPLDAHNTASCASSCTNTVGPSLANTVVSEIHIASGVPAISSSCTGGAGVCWSPWTEDSIQNAGGWGHVVTSATGNYQITITSSGSGANCTTAASFKP
jgi:hypothetical protein